MFARPVCPVILSSSQGDTTAATLLGTGAYSLPDTALLLAQRPETVSRWAFGYRRRREYAPLIRTELPRVEGQRALTFVELVELLYIGAFLERGVSWARIHQAADVAARMHFGPHPFACRRFLVDGSVVYAALREEDGEESLVHLVGHGQNAIGEIVRPYLSQLDFDSDDIAARWYPLGKDGGVVLDPEHSFGAPVLTERYVPTETLSAAYEAEREDRGPEGARARVAWLYDVHPHHVDTAMEFHTWLRRRAAA